MFFFMVIIVFVMVIIVVIVVVMIVVVVVTIVFAFTRFLFGLRGSLFSFLAFSFVLGFLGLIFHLVLRNRFFGPFRSEVEVVGDEESIEDGPGLDLPNLDRDELEAVVGVDLIVFGVFRVRNLRVDPFAFVIGVGDLGAAQGPLYSGLGISGASHSPSSSSSQSSGLLASGSLMFRGMSSQPSGLTASGSGMFLASTQSEGFD